MNDSQSLLLTRNRQLARVVTDLLGASWPGSPVTVASEYAAGQQGQFELVLVDCASMPAPARHGVSPSQESGQWLALNVSEQDVEQAGEWIEQGYAGMLTAEGCLEQLVKAVRTLKAGEYWFPRRALSLALRTYQQGGDDVDQLVASLTERFGLTPREASICLQVLKGMSNGQIAERSYISINTVKSHVSHLMTKLGVRSRRELLSQIAGTSASTGGRLRNPVACTGFEGS